MFEANDVVLFQGDSITDAARAKDLEMPNQPAILGHGYALMSAAKLLLDHPDKQLQCYNKGISGHRVVDLYARWKKDTLNLKPNVLSILIGVNDTWHHFNYDNGVEVPRYEKLYDMLLSWTLETLPEVKLILCEPFYLDCGVVTDEWKPELHERQAVVRKMVEKYNTKFVPFQSMFDEACKSAPAEYWAADGVHPSAAGHMLMSETWLEVALS